MTGPHATAEVMSAVHAQLAEAARPVRRPRAAAGYQAHADALRLPQDQRGLQPPLHVLHHPLDARRPRQPADRRGAREAERLLRAGVSELLVVSQDTSAYGVDVKLPDRILARPAAEDADDRARDGAGRLGRTHGAWVRLHYVYPYPHVDEVIARMTADPAQGGLLPYLDVPFQHASPRILRLMKRPANAEGTLRAIEAWRAARPDLVDPQHVHRRLSRRDRARVRRAARVPRRRSARSRRLLCLLAGRRRRRERAAGFGPRSRRGRAPRALHGGAGRDQRGAARTPGRRDDARAGRRS